MDGNTINAVIEIMKARHEYLMDLVKLFEKDGDHELAQNSRSRAWELVLTMEAIEQAHAATPSSKAA